MQQHIRKRHFRCGESIKHINRAHRTCRSQNKKRKNGIPFQLCTTTVLNPDERHFRKVQILTVEERQEILAFYLALVAAPISVAKQLIFWFLFPLLKHERGTLNPQIVKRTYTKMPSTSSAISLLSFVGNTQKNIRVTHIYVCRYKKSWQKKLLCRSRLNICFICVSVTSPPHFPFLFTTSTYRTERKQIIGRGRKKTR